MLARCASIQLIYEGKDITKEISKDLESFSFTDNISGVADDVSITLDDRDAKYIRDETQLGDKIQAKIKTTNWRGDGDSQTLNCGSFVIDAPNSSGRHRRFSLNGVSIPSDTNFKDTPKDRIWKEASIKKIARTIADNSNISLVFESKHNPVIQTVEQSKQSDMEFIQEVCKKNGLMLKI